MDLNLTNKRFLVTGATSGFGKAIAERLIHEGASVVIVARTEENINKLQGKYGDKCRGLVADVTVPDNWDRIEQLLREDLLHGAVLNAGGPPASTFMESTMNQWDQAYHQILRWKVALTKRLIPIFSENNYGRILFIESASVKQPIEALVLSNSLRLAVVGFVKTLSAEIGQKGINLNILAPGYHATPAMERLFVKKSLLLGISPEDAKMEFEKETLLGYLGDPDDLASLAVWLLSPLSKYITGQTISVDGGLIKGTMG